MLCQMIPALVEAQGVPYGILPPGIHKADLRELAERFAGNERRAWLYEGLLAVVEALRGAGCKTIYVDGSFVTGKEEPNDFDVCWDPTNVVAALLDPVLLDFSNRRAAQKLKYRGEMFISTSRTGSETFLEFFQVEKLTGVRKGIIQIGLA
jgi:hypothetical protein